MIVILIVLMMLVLVLAIVMVLVVVMVLVLAGHGRGHGGVSSFLCVEVCFLDVWGESVGVGDDHLVECFHPADGCSPFDYAS
ncbi:hypothetical protein CAURIC_06870 [Corynebacterium auriscanis]|nr:hypothetical protein CAURIC_06870 [Corynebacterium auriscanis]